MSVSTYLTKLKANELPLSDRVLLTNAGLGVGSGAAGHMFDDDESSPIASGLTGAGLAALTALGLGKVPAVQKFFAKNFDESGLGKDIGGKVNSLNEKRAIAKQGVLDARTRRLQAQDTIKNAGVPLDETPEQLNKALKDLFIQRMQSGRLARDHTSPYNEKMRKDLTTLLSGGTLPEARQKAAAEMFERLKLDLRTDAIAQARTAVKSADATSRELIGKRRIAKNNIDELNKQREEGIDFSKLAAGSALTGVGGVGGAIMGYEDPLG